MTRHRRPGLLQRWGRRHSAQPVPIPSQRPSGMDLVDAHSRIAHRISHEAMLEGRLTGVCHALCGARVLAASLTDPGRGQCRRCRS